MQSGYGVHSLCTLNEFVINQTREYPEALGHLGSLLRDIAFVAKRIHAQVNNAGLVDSLRGGTGQVNLHGEHMQKLDQFANDILVQTLANSRHCVGIASEEEKEVILFDTDYNRSAGYVVHFDPIDGSGNIDVGGSLGTTFCIYKRLSARGQLPTQADFLQPGTNIIAAGYVLYGSSTLLVYATERGTNAFTLDTTIGEFCLSHPNVKIPTEGKIYSVNLGRQSTYQPFVKRYLTDIQNRGQFSLRYVGTMVADVHRDLIQGGVFLYPSVAGKPQGKLRLAYECNPLAFVVEKAGGKAVDETGARILDLPLTHIHQRSTLCIGVEGLVNDFLRYLSLG